MADEYIRKQDAVKECGEWYVEEGTEEGFIGTVSQMLDMFSPADVVPVSAYKQVMLERNTMAEQLKRIGKDIREVIDDVVHLQKLLSDVVQVDAIIQFIETRKQLHSSPAWYEFGIVKELDEVKRFVEKMQAEEDNDQ